MKLNFLFFSILLSCLHLNAKELVDLIESDIQEVMTNVIEWRHHFHEYPELSNREFETAKYIKSKLEDMGLNVETGIAHTGLIAMIRGQKEGPLMALRADMDALPVEEKLNLPFSSKVRTVYQGQDVGVMHACGHDAHMAVLLGVAEFLTNNKDIRSYIDTFLRFSDRPTDRLAKIIYFDDDGDGSFFDNNIPEHESIEAQRRNACKTLLYTRIFNIFKRLVDKNEYESDPRFKSSTGTDGTIAYGDYIYNNWIISAPQILDFICIYGYPGAGNNDKESTTTKIIQETITTQMIKINF